MAADSKYPGEKEQDRQAEESLVRYTALREWLKSADAAGLIRDSKAQIVAGDSTVWTGFR